MKKELTKLAVSVLGSVKSAFAIRRLRMEQGTVYLILYISKRQHHLIN